MEHDRVMSVRRLFAAIEQGDEAELRQIYAEKAVQVEHPNKLKPKGDRRGVDKMLSDLKRGKTILREEHYEIVEVIATDALVAVQVRWTGVLAVPIGELKAGDSMVCESGIFLRFEDDRIVEQHNYDCFPEPGSSAA